MNGRGVCALIVACLLCMLGATPAAAQTVYHYVNSTDSANGGINEYAAPCNNTFKRTFNVPASEDFTIDDVTIGVLMAHSYRGDLLIYLSLAGGPRIQLADGAGTGANNYNVLFDDAAPSAIASYTSNDNPAPNAGTAVPAYKNTYRPVVPLSGFDGLNSVGTWTLEICDRYRRDSGTFYQADLYLTSRPSLTDLSVTKSSTLVSDPTSGTINPIAIPGAELLYCILVENTGTATATDIVATDVIPADMTYVPGSMQSGTTCGDATVFEDDNSVGPDETNPVGASVSGATLTISAAALNGGETMAVSYSAVVN